MRRSVGVMIVAGALVGGLAAPPASAAPGDPAPGWPTARDDVMYRDVDVAQSGQVFDVGLADPDILDHAFLERGSGEEWSSEEIPARPTGGVVAGRNDYAVAVSGKRSWVYSGGSWGSPVTVAPEIWQSRLVGNSSGVAVLLWSAGVASGAPFVSRLTPGGSWTAFRVTGVPAGVPRDVAVNDAGKITVVWAEPEGDTAEIRRAVLLPGSRTWTPARRLGTVNRPRPDVTIVTDGQGRETLLAGSKLWRQDSSTTLPAYQFRTSARAVLAAGSTATRLVWSVENGARYEVHTRFADPNWQAETVLWTSPPDETGCYVDFDLGVGMVPGGRSYVALGVSLLYDDEQGGFYCGRSIAQFLTVDRSDTVLNSTDLGSFEAGGHFQVDAASAGPVALTYQHGVDHTPGSGLPNDGFWRMQFFSR